MFNRFILVLFISCLSSYAYSQTGAIKGKIIDKATGDGIPFANVVISSKGTQKGGAATDFDGNFSISPIQPGTYDVESSYLGYANIILKGVVVAAEKIVPLKLEMETNDKVLDEVVIKTYVIPLISADETSTGATVTNEEIRELPTRDVAAIVSTSTATFAADEGKNVSIKGARDEGTIYYIDGIKVSSSGSSSARAIPTASISQLSVITGGVPAAYGDAMGGIVNITTKGPSSKFYGGFEMETSKPFDNWDYNLIGLNISGPILKRNEKPLLGFFAATEIFNSKDESPSAIDIPQVNEDRLNEIKAKPIIPNPNGPGLMYAAETLTPNDIYYTSLKPNRGSEGIRVSGKLDMTPTKNTVLTLGGSYNYGSFFDWNGTSSTSRQRREYANMLLNSENNREQIRNTNRVYARFTQNFGGNTLTTDEEKKDAENDIIKNAYYTLQYDYTLDKTKYWNPKHKDNLWNYGYVGKFERTAVPTYVQAPNGYIVRDTTRAGAAKNPLDTTNHKGREISWFRSSYWYSVDDSVTSFVFSPSTLNPITANFTSTYQELVGSFSGPAPGDKNMMMNGYTPNQTSAFVSDLFYNVGNTNTSYIILNNEQHRFTAEGGADIKDHSLRFGVEYEKRINRYYQMNPMDLWTTGRQNIGNGRQRTGIITDSTQWPNDPYFDTLTVEEYNELGLIGFTELSGANYNVIQRPDGTWQITGDINGGNSNFEKNLRAKLGMGNTGYLNIDNLEPNDMDIKLFSPNELLNDGSNYIFYQGYNIYGEMLDEEVQLKDFFNDTLANGEHTRKIDAVRPTYIAGYIQDKFAIDDLVFNVGVRVDQFDANQQVLKDRYALVEIRTVGEVAQLNNADISHPANVGADWAVYVNDPTNPKTITGYRNQDKWYDPDGREVSDPRSLNGGNAMTPYKKDVTDTKNEVGANIFKDYEPQYNIMPRISFSFPISLEAQFFAHYDILTQRPTLNSPMAFDYIYLDNPNRNLIENPDLKPQRTTDYQVGFKQKVSPSSAITLSAFYRDMQDLIQARKLVGVYPLTSGSYTTYDNVDFGSVKGFSFDYDLRRTRNVRLRAGYTLQFANGTASSTSYVSSLANAGYPNLRTPMPLDFDQRHQIKFNLDYRFAGGEDYNGPKWGKRILQDMGANFTVQAGSGTPYTRIIYPIAEVWEGVNNRSTFAGSINGSRKPWQVRVNSRVDKDFKFKGKSEGAREMYLNVYIYVSNLLNTQNILNVYPFTGSPEDDGYLASAEGIKDINSRRDPEAYEFLYLLKLNNPYNYTLPRRWKLGVSLNF